MTDDLKVIVDADAGPLRREFGSATGTVKLFGETVRRETPGAAAFSAAVDKQKESLHGLVSVAKVASVGIAGGAALAVASMVKTGAAFESQMARVQAVTGATTAEMGELRQLAIKLGADTKFSAGEAAEAMYELASAGFDVKETQAALPGVLALAAASSVGLAEAAEINSNALRGFGLASSESTHVADVLAQSVNSSSVEMTDLQLSLKYIGPVAKATGESFESMIGAVSLMGDAGIKGEQAGTTLRAGLLRLVKPTKQVKDGLGDLGLEAEELQGPNGLLPLPELVGKLQEGMKGLSTAQQNTALASIFGNEALSGMLTVVDAGPAKLRKLTTEFEHSDGASAKAAKTMNDTVKGSFEELKGSFETMEIEVFEKFAPQLKGALKDATAFVNQEGDALQEALSKAMATPEFKQGDVGKKAEVLADAIGEVWSSSGIGDDIREGLVKAFNWALPKVADAAGKAGLGAAEAMVKGFFESDALGRLVIGAWLFTKLGGFAALRAAGARAGTEVAAGMATSVEAGVGATGAASAVKAGAAQAASSRQLLIANSSGTVVAAKTIGTEAGTALGQSAADAVGREVGGTTMATKFRSGLSTLTSVAKGVGVVLAVNGLIGGMQAAIENGDRQRGLSDSLHDFGVGLVHSFGLDLGETTGEQFQKGFSRTLHTLLVGGTLTKQIPTGHIEELAKANATTKLPEFEPVGGEKWTRLFDEEMARLGSQVKARYPSVKELFGGLWDQMKPEEKALARNVRGSLIAAQKVASRFHIEAPPVTLETDPKNFRKFESGIEDLRSGVLTRMGDIRKVFDQNSKLIASSWAKGSTGWREATAKNMKSMIDAIQSGMDQGVIKAGKGKKEIQQILREIKLVEGNDPLGIAEGFASSWKKAGSVNKQQMAKVKSDLGKMPKDARQTAVDAMVGMAHTLEVKGQLVKGSTQKLNSALAAKFGATAKQVEMTTAAAMTNVATSAREGATGTSSALSNIFDNLSSALAAVGSSKIPKFTATQLSIASQYHHTREATQKGFAHGGFVPGSDRRDHVPAVLGGREAILTVHDQPEVQAGLAVGKAMGVTRNGSLGELFSGPRKPNYFAKGGFANGQTGNAGTLPHPGLAGPEPLRTLGQDSINLGFDAAQKYLRAHMEPPRVLAMLKAAEAITSMGFEYKYGGGHGSFGIQPVDCSGLVSYILHAGGFIDAPMSVQQGSGLYTLGVPGPGKDFTWGVRGTSGANAHTMISVRKPTGTWGFFESGGSGGGAHEDSGWDGAFQFRHMPGYAKGGFVDPKGGLDPKIQKAAPAGARAAIARYGQEAFDPKSPHFVGWGFAKGGWTKVGATIDPEYGNPNYSDHGGMSFAELLQAGANRNLKSQSLTATLGIGPPHYTAEGQDYGMAMGTPIHVRMPGSKKNLVMYKNDVGSGQAGDSHYKVDLHQNIANALGWSGNADIEVSTTGKDENAKEEKEHSYKEEVPAEYHGCKTDSLNFGSPKNLKGIEKELHHWRNELSRYRSAAAAARKENRPATAEKLRHNITAIEGQIHQLEREAAKERREIAKKKVTRRLAKQLAKITGAESLIEGAQERYAHLNEYAGHVVDLEPVEGEVAPFVPEPRPSTKGMKKDDREKAIKEWERRNVEAENAYNVHRRDDERAFERELIGYIEDKEGGAYAKVLGAETDWRKQVLIGESLVAGDWSSGVIGGMQGGFEGRIERIRDHISAIDTLPPPHTEAWWEEHSNALQKLRELLASHTVFFDADGANNPSRYIHKQLSQLPMLHFKDQEVSKSLATAREAFYPGSASLKDPKPPRAGTGTFEDDLAEVQGDYFPGLHEQLKELPTVPQAGKFGGAIWDTQEVIQGLGLKISEQVARIAEGVELNEFEEEEPEEVEPDIGAWTAAKEAISLERQQNYLLGQGELTTMRDFFAGLGPGIPYLGAFMTGTGGLRVGNTGLAMLHRDEMVVPDPKGPANSQFAGGAAGPAHHEVNLTFRDRSGQLVELVDARVDGKLAKVNQDLGREATRRHRAPGRS